MSSLANVDFALWAGTAGTMGAGGTLRTELAEYTQTVPSGFLSWMGEAGGPTNVTVNVTGQAVTAAVGAVTVSTPVVTSITVDVTGQAVTASVGSVTATGKISTSTTVGGQEVTAGVGSVTATGKQNVSATVGGQAVTASVGQVTAIGKQNVSTTVASPASTASVGSVTVSTATRIDVTVIVGSAGGATAPSSSLLTSYTPGGDRNDIVGEVGVRIGIGPAPLAVSWIGMRVHTGNSGPRTLNLYEFFGDTLQATATVDLTGKVAGDWVWASIPEVTLGAGGYYALMMEVTGSSMQPWNDVGAAAMKSPDINNIYYCYRSGGSGISTGGPDQMFGGAFDLGSGGVAGAGFPGSTASGGSVTATGATNVSTTIVGQAVTAAVGTVTASGKSNVSTTVGGQPVVASVGTVTATGKANVTVGGQAITASVGSVTATGKTNVSTTVAGQAATAAVGSVIATGKSNVSTTVTGLQANSAVGSVTVAVGGGVSVAVTGQPTTASVGTVTASGKTNVSTTVRSGGGRICRNGFGRSRTWRHSGRRQPSLHGFGRQRHRNRQAERHSRCN